MTILDDAGNAFSGVVTGAQNAFTGLITDAQTAGANLLHQAQNEAASLAHVENGRVLGPLAEEFGSDPVQFCNNAVRAGFTQFVGIVNDCARRSGRSTYAVTDPKTKKQTNVPATLTTGSPFNVVVLTCALAAQSNPSLFVDAAGRVSSGVGGGHGIDDVHFWPHTVWGGKIGPRGIVGIDDALGILSIIAAVATILTLVAKFAIPALAAAVGFVTKIVAPPPAPPPPSSGTVFGIPPVALLVAAAIALALVLLWKPITKAAGGAAGGA